MAYFGLLVYTLILFVRPMDWIPGLNTLHLLDVVVAVTTVLWFMSVTSRETLPANAAPQTKLMAGFFLATLMSHVRHGYLGEFGGDNGLVPTFVDFSKVLLLYIFIVTLINSVRRANKLILVMTLGCLFMSLNGILQYHRGFGFGYSLPLMQGDVPRVIGFGMFNDPNDLALILIALLPFLMSKVQDKWAAMPARMLCGLATIPMVYCIFRTNSRGGWLAFGVMVTTYICLRMRSKKFAVVMGVLAFSVVLIFGPSRMGGEGGLDRSAKGRLTAWAYGNQMLKRNPIFGVGYKRYTEFSDDSRVAHNSFVHCWAELGLFGYFFFMGLIIASLKDGYALMSLKTVSIEEGDFPQDWAEDQPRERSPPGDWDDDARHEDSLPRADLAEMRRLGYASLASLSGYLAASAFLSRTYTHPLYMLFALVAALRVVCSRSNSNEDIPLLQGTFGKPDLKYVFLATILSIPATYVLIRVAQ